MNFWLLVGLSVLFGWMGLVGLVRAEFLRARNFEYVRAAKALGVSAMRHHVPPRPAQRDGRHADHAALHRHRHHRQPDHRLDYLGFGLPASSPSLGEMTQQAKQNLQAPWLAFSAFFTFARSCCRCLSSSLKASAMPLTRRKTFR